MTLTGLAGLDDDEDDDDDEELDSMLDEGEWSGCCRQN